MDWLRPDGRKLLAARALRTFGYGYLAVALGLYLDLPRRASAGRAGQGVGLVVIS